MTATRIARPSLRRLSPARPSRAQGELVRAQGELASRSVSPKRRSVARRPSWLKHPELDAANQAVESACPSLASLSAAELTARTKAVLKQEIGFISNAQFSDPEFAKLVFDSPLGLAPRQSAVAVAMVRKAGIDLPVHLSRMCEAKLLTADQERILFQRMNFLRCQAAVQRALLDVTRPSVPRLELIQRLLALADWHRDRIVEANTRLVFSIVKKFVNTNNSFDDLLSDGVMALIRAVEKYDYNRGFRFSTYATQVVRRNAYRQIVQKQQERNKVASGLLELDVEPSDEDRSSSISESRWHELRSRLTLMLSDLDRREKFIIRARFSLGSHRRVHTLQALADRLGVSKERVRQLERRAMEKLRAMAGEVKLVELEA